MKTRNVQSATMKLDANDGRRGKGGRFGLSTGKCRAAISEQNILYFLKTTKSLKRFYGIIIYNVLKYKMNDTFIINST